MTARPWPGSSPSHPCRFDLGRGRERRPRGASKNQPSSLFPRLPSWASCQPWVTLGASLHAGIPAHTTARPIFLTHCRRSMITPNPAPAAHLVLGHVSRVCSKPAFEGSKLSTSPRGLYHPSSSCLPRPLVPLFLRSLCTIELFPRTSSHPPLLTSPAQMAPCPPTPRPVHYVMHWKLFCPMGSPT